MAIYSKIAELRQSGQSFALATVVARQAPVSSHLGDKAIVFEDGRFEGYVGGACSREIVRNQALQVLRLGKPRLFRITPEAARVVLEHANEQQRLRPQGQLHEDSAALPRPLLCGQRPRSVRPA